MCKCIIFTSIQVCVLGAFYYGLLTVLFNGGKLLNNDIKDSYHKYKNIFHYVLPITLTKHDKGVQQHNHVFVSL